MCPYDQVTFCEMLSWQCAAEVWGTGALAKLWGTSIKITSALLVFYSKPTQFRYIINQWHALTKISLWSELSDLKSSSILVFFQCALRSEGGVLILYDCQEFQSKCQLKSLRFLFIFGKNNMVYYFDLCCSASPIITRFWSFGVFFQEILSVEDNSCLSRAKYYIIYNYINRKLNHK